MTGAASIFSRDQYPVAPDIAHPTAKPRMIDADFMSGDPNCSTKMIDTKTEKPRPMSFGSPLITISSQSYFFTLRTYHARGFGAEMLGHNA